MQAADKKVDDFFTSHQEKYKNLQGGYNYYKNSIDYNKAMEAKSPEVPRTTPRLYSSDVHGLQSVISNQLLLGGEEIIPDGVIKVTQLMERGSHRKNMVAHEAGARDVMLTESFDKECKDMAKELSDGIDQYRKTHQAPEHPQTQALRDRILDYAKLHVDSLQEGRHIGDKLDGEHTMALDRVSTLLPQLDTSLFAPENLDKTEAALKNYPLDKYMRQGLEIHRMETDYKDRKDSMTQQEKDAFQEKLRDKKEDFLDTAKDLHKKALNPSPETLSLFGSPDLLTAPKTGFIGGRGLDALIRNYEAEFAKTDIPDKHMDQLSSALDKVSAKRMGLFDSEGDDRRFMREQAEKMQDNLKKLKSGMVETPTGPRPMTQDEKNDLLADTIDGLNDLSSKTDRYINHATKNGTKTPSGAGKTRLEGARELKDLTNELQDTLMKEQQAQMKRENSRMEKQAPSEAKQQAYGGANKENGRKSVSLKELQDKEKKDSAQRNRRNSVRESAKRPKLDTAKHGKEDAMQNNKAVAPKKK